MLEKKTTINELKDFTFENFYRWIGFHNENIYYSMKYQKKRKLLLLSSKLIEKKILDVSNAKKYYNSYLKRKNTKLTKRWKIITQQPKTIESPNIATIKSVIRIFKNFS